MLFHTCIIQFYMGKFLMKFLFCPDNTQDFEALTLCRTHDHVSRYSVSNARHVKCLKAYFLLFRVGLGTEFILSKRWKMASSHSKMVPAQNFIFPFLNDRSQ